MDSNESPGFMPVLSTLAISYQIFE